MTTFFRDALFDQPPKFNLFPFMGLVFSKMRDWEKISGIRDPVRFQDAGSGIQSRILRDYSKRFRLKNNFFSDRQS